MNKIGYSLFLLLLLLFTSVYTNYTTSKQLQIKEKKLTQMRYFANEYSKLSEKWIDNDTKSIVDKLLKSNLYRNSKVQKVSGSKKIEIIINNSDINVISSIVNRILNENIKIQKIDISKTKLRLVVIK
jgi:hypothetical protein